jgi:serine/threonine-protein kinase
MAMRPVFSSDIYALGATCLYLLTGKSPKKFDRDPDTGALVWENEINVSSGFKKVLRKMLEPNTRERYKTAEELLVALDVAPFEQGLNRGMINQKNQRISLSDVQEDFNNDDLSTQVDDTNLSATARLKQAVKQRKIQNKKNSISIKWNQDNFVSAYQNGKKDFSNQELVNFDFTGARLNKFIFRYSQLQGAIFTETNLSQANFYSANLQGAILTNANLSQAYFAKSNLQNADFRGSNLQGADLTNANLKDANLCGCNLKNVKVSQSQLKQAKINWGTTFPDGGRRWWKVF